MKKTITKLIAIVLVIIVTFSTTACGLTEEKAYDNQQINDFAKLSQQTYTSKIKEINQTTQNPSTPIVFTDVESLPPDPKALEAWQYASHVPGFKIRLLRKAATATAKDITAFNMDSSIIYGGSLIKIEDPEQFGSFTAMQCKRAPMTLSLNLYASPNVDFNPVTVENTLDGFRGGVNKLFSQTFKKGAIIPQQFAIEPHIVESEEQISSLLGLSNDIDVGKTKGGVSLIEALDYGEPSDASKNKPRQIKAILIVKQVFANVS
ncbi:MAG: thiol-activated cytolysin family protein, partial [Clostridia bacterium]